MVLKKNIINLKFISNVINILVIQFYYVHKIYSHQKNVFHNRLHLKKIPLIKLLTLHKILLFILLNIFGGFILVLFSQ